MKKKGYIQDFLFFGLIIFVIVIIIIAGGKLIDSFNDRYQTSGASSNAKTLMSEGSTRFSSIFDNIFIIVFVLFMLTIFVTFFMLDTHPALFFVVVIVFAFIMIPLGIIGNVYEKVSTNDALSSTSTNFVLINFIMQHWAFIITVFGFLGIILLFAKLRVGVFR